MDPVDLPDEPVSTDELSPEARKEDPDVEPMIKLKSGVDLRQLREGTTFEVASMDDEEYAQAAEDKKYFDPEEIFRNEEYGNIPNWEEGGTDDPNDGRTAFEVMATKMEDITHEKDGGVVKKILKRGFGNVVPEGALVRAHYDGYLEYADEPFDSSRFQNAIRRHKLGKGELIPGLEIALSTMKKSELAQFILKPDYAFGKLGSPPRIPANATVLFQVELVDFTDKAGAEEFFCLSREERKTASFSVVLKMVEAEKKEANDLFKAKIYGRALSKYKKVIDVLEEYHAQGDKDDAQRQNLLYKLYLNAGLACLRLNKPGQALHFCRQALYVQETSAKAFYIRGKAFMLQHHFKQAGDALDKARRLNPNSPDIQAAIEELSVEMKKEELMERETCKRMFRLQTDNAKPADENKDPNSVETNLPSSVADCTPEFKQCMQETLQDFVKDADTKELPLRYQDYSVAERALITTIAQELGLSCKKVSEGNNTRIMIRKIP